MKKPYINKEKIEYISPRYNRQVIVEEGFGSDGATGALDIDSDAWWIHDKLCETGKFADGTHCTNWQASWILADVLWSEGRWFRSFYWGWLTFLYGCKKCRKNGMFRLNTKN